MITVEHILKWSQEVVMVLRPMCVSSGVLLTLASALSQTITEELKHCLAVLLFFCSTSLYLMLYVEKMLNDDIMTLLKKCYYIWVIPSGFIALNQILLR